MCGHAAFAGLRSASTQPVQPIWRDDQCVSFAPALGGACVGQSGATGGVCLSAGQQDRAAGGFGMFRTMWFYNNSQSNGFQSTTPILSTIDGVTPNVLYTNPIPNGLIPPADNLGMLTGVGVGENFNDPYTEPEENTRWSFGFQRELTPTTTLEANYVGETTFHLPLEGGGSAFIDFSSSKQHSQRLQLAYLPTQYGSLGNNLFESVPNPFFGIDSNLLAGTALASPNIPLFNLLVRYPQFGPENLGEYFDTAGMSYYHSFQMTLTKRASHGLSVLGSYTFQKTLDRYFFLNPE